ncbi:MAG: hypothetical protein AAGF07_05065 [Patescibacteria group bacterium]
MSTYFIQENLFDSNLDSLPAQSEQEVVTRAIDTTSSEVNVSWYASFFGDEAITDFIIQLNSFTLAWCILYSALFVADFYFYRLKYSDGDVDRERLGVSSLRRAFNLWFGYVFCLLALILYSYVPAFGMLTILVYVAKIVVADLPMILDIIHDYIGLNGIHTNYKRIVSPVIKLLKFNLKK